jgi:hypothetical protein
MLDNKSEYYPGNQNAVSKYKIHKGNHDKNPYIRWKLEERRLPLTQNYTIHYD